MHVNSKFRALLLILFVATLAIPPSHAAAPVSVVSFNIQFLGHFKGRDNGALAGLLAPYDLVIVQELIAPPYAGTFPDGKPFKPDAESTAFFSEMASRGFKYVLSEEDTGTGPNNHMNSSATEWWVAYYKPDRIQPANDLPHGFLAADRTDHPHFERVPYAFPFRAGGADLVFISVHLQPGGDAKSQKRRAEELKTISTWIGSRPGTERDYVILGDIEYRRL